MNATSKPFNHLRAELEGVRIHFVHQRARGGHGLPLVALLTDPPAHGIDGPAFDVVLPSLQGYGFEPRP
jgi:hypothetical protein